MGKFSDEEIKQIIFPILERAYEEFRFRGEVETVLCDKCNNLIELKWLGALRSAAFAEDLKIK